MPLVDVNEATLTQMTDMSLATRNDYYVIADWQRDIRACRARLLEVIERADRLYVPIVLTGWNNDDQVLVLLASPTIMRRAAPPDGRTSSLVNCRFGLA